MSNTYEFYLPTIRCESCTASILHALNSEDFVNKNGIVIEFHQVDRFKKEIKLKIKNNKKKTTEVKKIIRQTIEDLGFTCIDITPEMTLPKTSFWKKILTSNWLLGTIGTGSGIALLILSIVFSGGLSLGVMYAIGAVSTLLTLALGAPFYYQAIIKLLKSRTLTMDTLFTVSTLTVIGVSLAAFAFPWLPMMFEAGLLIFGFRYLGLAIEETITQKVAVEKKFKDRLPREVTVLATEELPKQQRKLSTIQAEEQLLIAAGGIIPVDGECLSPSAIYDTIITGSVLPRAIKPGERVLAGMRLAEDAEPMVLKAKSIILSLKKDDYIPVDGFCESDDCRVYDEELQQENSVKKGEPLTAGTRLTSPAKVKVAAVGSYSYLHRLDNNNEQAQFEKAPIEEATTKILQYFIPAVIMLALLSGGIMSLFFPFAVALQCVVSVLVAACPCTLGLITPLAVKIGINKAAEHGVQFKSAKALQAAANVNAVVFDVHGTVTMGIPTAINHKFNSKLVSNQMMLSYFAALERQSSHPIASAIVDYVKEQQIDELPISILDIDNSNHSGLKAKITKPTPNPDSTNLEETEELILGSQAIMQENGIDISVVERTLNLKGGQSAVYLARDKQLLGYMIIIDPVRPGAKEAITILKQEGIAVFICTGADKATAERYGELLDIPNDNICYGSVGISESIQDNSKTAFIEKLKAQGFNVAMVGDAANDSGAVSSTVGVAVKSKAGDEIIQQQASAVVQEDSLLPVASIFAIAKQTISNINQNLGFSLIYNMSSMLLAGGLLVAIGITLNPAVGVALMILQTSLVLLNAYRFKSQKLEHLQQAKVQPTVEYKESYGCLSNCFHGNQLTTTVTNSQEENSLSVPLFKQPMTSEDKRVEANLSEDFVFS
ncbi:heavy metal translocating P-type ATPase [Legionella cardiaca]|uniref:HAD-IC family P-type ATPase n=1 Tax=Legionella cardiaca TaxID=1071983 RepID=A0ABY8AS33_9GAMM|nr:HAD-IC family P-type ATPase [Legionella cardiaca]WED43490.1 HAD-IC family P-type ATPase [Legionella cardiaca]